MKTQKQIRDALVQQIKDEAAAEAMGEPVAWLVQHPKYMPEPCVEIADTRYHDHGLMETQKAQGWVFTPLFSGKQGSLSENTSRNGRDCKHGHLARACEICDLEAKLAAAEEELTRFRNGYKGSCYACEIVGEKNVELESKVRVLREALEYAVNQVPEMGTVPGVKAALATTAPEGGEV